jgi:hypothetical protein
MVRLDGRGAFLSHPYSAEKKKACACFPAAAFVTITCALPVKHDLRTFTKRESAGEAWRRLGNRSSNWKTGDTSPQVL